MYVKLLGLLEEGVRKIDLILDVTRMRAYLKTVCHKRVLPSSSPAKPVQSTGQEIDFSFVSLAAAKT